MKGDLLMVTDAMGGSEKRVKQKIDPRYFVLLFLTTFVIAGQTYLGFLQKWDAIFSSVISAVAAELILSRLVYRKWRFPLSAVISGLGISLLISSTFTWPYVLTSVLAIGCKYFIRYKDNHIFNPNNIALVFMLLFLPQYAVSTPKQWSNGFEVMAVILLLGALAAYMANRLDTVIAFAASFVLFAIGRHLFFDQPLLWALGPAMGASFQLFTFFMITDPKTTPPTRQARILFAVAIALVDAVFRIESITNSQFYSAFLVTLLLGIPYRLLRSRKERIC
jgi:Na+-translocating ferredoxin:NAD+ oxidoreductase RnfD subunit